MIGKNGGEWTSRSHFYGFAAQMMRRVLVDYARQHSAGKRGNGNDCLPLLESAAVAPGRPAPISEIDEALQTLERRNPRQAKVVEMRFFGGLTEDEMAEVLGVTARTVRRDWTIARAWLYGQLSG